MYVFSLTSNKQFYIAYTFMTVVVLFNCVINILNNSSFIHQRVNYTIPTFAIKISYQNINGHHQ